MSKGRAHTHTVEAEIRDWQSAHNTLTQILNQPAATKVGVMTPRMVSDLARAHRAIDDKVGPDSPHSISMRFLIKQHGGEVKRVDGSNSSRVEFPSAESEMAYVAAAAELAQSTEAITLPVMPYNIYNTAILSFGLSLFAERSLWLLFVGAPGDDLADDEDETGEGDVQPGLVAEPA